jgi:uncharacterized protein YjbK
MKQEIEIEFKNLLTEEEFRLLLIEYSLSESQFTLQQNHYFDTASFSLKETGAALRIRYKKGVYTLTLKQPLEEGILETHQSLSNEEANNMLTGGSLVQGDVYSIVQSLQVDPTSIIYLGTLETNRAEVLYRDGTLVFDHSHYLNKDDFELEYEATHFKQGQEDFATLLKKYGIPTRKTENKIRRFFNEKMNVLKRGGV